MLYILYEIRVARRGRAEAGDGPVRGDTLIHHTLHRCRCLCMQLAEGQIVYMHTVAVGHACACCAVLRAVRTRGEWVPLSPLHRWPRMKRVWT